MAHHKSCFTVSNFVDMVETGEFDRAEVFICPLDEDGGDSAEDSGMKTKEVSINISLLFELSFNDFSSWIIRRGESGYQWAHFSLLHTILFCKSTLKATIVQGSVQSRHPLCILTPI